ncbi:hypothetical protein ACFLSF_04815 [Candidatus Bipolaricaulota bacterium]
MIGYREIAVDLQVDHRSYTGDCTWADRIDLDVLIDSEIVLEACLVESARSSDDQLRYRLEGTQLCDLDADGVKEILLYWESGPLCSWCILSTTIVDITQATRGLEVKHLGIGEDELRTSVLGAVWLLDVDDDPAIEIVQFSPVFGKDPKSGLAECMLCRHRYRISVFEYSNGKLAPDRRWNKGSPVVTGLKYYESEFKTQMLKSYAMSPMFGVIAMRGSASFAAILAQPQPGQELSPPLRIEGEVSADQASIDIALLDETGHVLYSDTVLTFPSETGQTAVFSVDVYPKVPASRLGELIFSAPQSAPSRGPSERLVVPVLFDLDYGRETTVFFLSSDMGTSEVAYQPIRRWTAGTAVGAVEAVLAGPTRAEVESGIIPIPIVTEVEVRDRRDATGNLTLGIYGTGYSVPNRRYETAEPEVDPALLASQIVRTLRALGLQDNILLTLFGGPFGMHEYSVLITPSDVQ